MNKMGKMFNIGSMNIPNLVQLYDTLTVNKYLGIKPPAGFTEDDYLNMRHLTHWLHYFKISFNLSKAVNTEKLKRIISDFDRRINNTKL